MYRRFVIISKKQTKFKNQMSPLVGTAGGESWLLQLSWSQQYPDRCSSFLFDELPKLLQCCRNEIKYEGLSILDEIKLNMKLNMRAAVFLMKYTILLIAAIEILQVKRK